jgi:hypothetical protein
MGIRYNKMFEKKLNYMYNNPVEHCFLSKARDYPWSSKVNYIFGTSVNSLRIIRYNLAEKK